MGKRVKKVEKKMTKKALRKLMHPEPDEDDLVNPLGLQAGDRITFRWTRRDPTATEDNPKDDIEFTTKGYVLNIYSHGIMLRFPSHKNAKSVRYFSWHTLSYLEDASRLQRDTMGALEKIMGEKCNWYNGNIITTKGVSNEK